MIIFLTIVNWNSERLNICYNWDFKHNKKALLEQQTRQKVYPPRIASQNLNKILILDGDKFK